jgi:hypothetical protein
MALASGRVDARSRETEVLIDAPERCCPAS